MPGKTQRRGAHNFRESKRYEDGTGLTASGVAGKYPLLSPGWNFYIHLVEERLSFAAGPPKQRDSGRQAPHALQDDKRHEIQEP